MADLSLWPMSIPRSILYVDTPMAKAERDSLSRCPILRLEAYGVQRTIIDRMRQDGTDYYHRPFAWTQRTEINGEHLRQTSLPNGQFKRKRHHPTTKSRGLSGRTGVITPKPRSPQPDLDRILLTLPEDLQKRVEMV